VKSWKPGVRRRVEIRAFKTYGDVVFGHLHRIGLIETAYGPLGCRVMAKKGECFEGYDTRRL
jgi:hypothetical protein